MVSFPLTIGIGLMLTLIALPDITVFVERQFGTVENQILAVTEDATKVPHDWLRKHMRGTTMLNCISLWFERKR